jgi:hypothetical protein
VKPITPPPSGKPATPSEPVVTGGGGEDAQTGSLVADSKPSAKVLVDGRDTGKSTPARIKLPAGKHRVTFVVGEQKFTYNIMVEPDQDYELSKSLAVEPE